ncbi:MAG: protein translocase subunit SecF [Phycisphaeraceae bacterium]|nr:protein translocase subunit SecF [Phycisphaeraceae bacterium]
MKRPGIHLLIIALLAAGFVYLLVPPKESLRLGRDLRGGVSLIYSVEIPPGSDNSAVVTDVINVLKDRANPQGVFDISFLPQGFNRFEVVMPLPSPEVQALQLTFRSALENLVSSSRVDDDELVAAAKAGTAVTRFGGADEGRRAQLAALERAAARAMEARQALESAALAGDDAALRAATASLAEAEVALEQGADMLASAGISERRLIRALALSPRPRAVLDPVTGKPRMDDRNRVVMGPSERDEEIAIIREQIPWLAPELDRVLETWAAFEARRTGLDGPEDLKRLFRGAGVLEFFIAVDAANPEGVNPVELRQQLAERGPEATDSPVARWFKVQDLKQWADTPALLAEARADPVSYFQQRRQLVAGVFEGEPYLLLYTTDGKSITHDPGRSWAMVGARPDVDDLGRPAVSFRLDTAGGALMGVLTANNLQKPMAVVLDRQVYTAANINGVIRDRGVIYGNFSRDDINYLTRVLQAGALAGQLSPEPISVNVLGPSLGADNLVRGLSAVLFSVVAVAILMLCYYMVAGIIANIALAFIILSIFGMMAFIDSTFTMPGLAGIALAIGMAVDANVLIFERMREEIVNNKEPLKKAARLGFARALSAILDGNVTNIMVCIVLIYFAGAEVKGFGVTMMIGAFATVLGGVWLSRVLMVIYTDWIGAKKLPMVTTVFPAVNRFLVPSIDWIRLRPMLFGTTITLAIIGIGLVASRGSYMLDTEFRGGVAMTMTTKRVETRPYQARAGDTPASIAAQITGVPPEAIVALNPGVDFAALQPGTELRIPTGPSSSDGRILISRQEVERRLQEIGRSGPSESVAGQFRTAGVLTLGEMTSDFQASSFQVKIGNPPGAVDESALTDDAVRALTGAFAAELDAQLSRSFRGSEGGHTAHTRPIQQRSLGEVVGRPELTDPIGRFRGGVAITLEAIDPPITLDEARGRLSRMRTQPDFSDAAGREVRIVGLDLANAEVPERGYTSIAILVSDPLVNLPKVPFETWDAQLAQREWALVTQALATETSLDQVASFSPTVAQSLLANAVIAVCLSLILMLGYIWVRFGSLRYSLGVILALSFNLCVCLGFLAGSEWLAMTNFGASIGVQDFRIDLNVIAGLLAITGYNINDSIVILDRVRERRGRMALATRQVVNDAINQTFSRTLLTSGTTIMSAVILVVLGGDAIRPFSMTLLVGLIAGTFSSIAIAAPLVYSGQRAEEEAGLAEHPSDKSALARPI